MNSNELLRGLLKELYSKSDNELIKELEDNEVEYEVISQKEKMFKNLTSFGMKENIQIRNKFIEDGSTNMYTDRYSFNYMNCDEASKCKFEKYIDKNSSYITDVNDIDLEAA